MKPKIYIFQRTKKQKIEKFSFSPHFGYYWKMKFYCKWSIFSYLVTYRYTYVFVSVWVGNTRT